MAPAPEALATTDPVLQVRNLSIGFRTPRGHVAALRHVNLDVPRGSIVGVVGESGSGKSSLALAIMGLMAGNAEILGGDILFSGIDLRRLSPTGLRDLRGRRMTMVFQDPMTSLNPVRAIGRQMIDIQYREQNMSIVQKRRRSADILRRVGLPDPEQQLDRYCHQFSGGMRQRIAIAMSLLEEPELLIADEPTTALDVTLEAQIIQLLRDLRQEFNTSILFISHNLGVVAELCDYIVVLYAGEVVESGPVREIFYRPAHPYTQALLACDPARLDLVQRELPTIAGEVPNLMRIPVGCVFTPRCPMAFAPCAGTPPPDVALDEAHHARCHLLTGEHDD